MNLETAAKELVRNVREHRAGGSEQAQVYGLAEETGEFVGAMRRWRGMARRSGTEEEAKAELADVIISAYVMAEIMGWSVTEITTDKLDIIFSRGWKTNVSDLDS